MEYVFGLAKNPRLNKAIEAELEQARRAYEDTGEAARVFKDLRYRTLKSWSRARRVVGKAEHLSKGATRLIYVRRNRTHPPGFFG